MSLCNSYGRAVVIKGLFTLKAWFEGYLNLVNSPKQPICLQFTNI